MSIYGYADMHPILFHTGAHSKTLYVCKPVCVCVCVCVCGRARVSPVLKLSNAATQTRTRMRSGGTPHGAHGRCSWPSSRHVGHTTLHALRYARMLCRIAQFPLRAKTAAYYLALTLCTADPRSGDGRGVLIHCRASDSTGTPPMLPRLSMDHDCIACNPDTPTARLLLCQGRWLPVPRG
jgi:hypothetical protein